MNLEPIYLIYALAAYLIGSISTAIITCKLMGLKDPRGVGSNNPGATNVLRHGGKKAAIITLLGDMLKGLLPVLVVSYLDPAAEAVAITGLSAFLGHIYPIYYRFKGGKGVATFYGALLGISWIAGIAALTVWLLIVFAFKMSALSALISAVSSPFIIWYFSGSIILTGAIALMTIMLCWRHRSNISNMLAGKEHRIGEKKD